MTRLSRILFMTGSLLTALAGPQLLHAHGDLQLRIADLTRRIQTATNNAAQLYLERGELQREHLNFPAAEADFNQAAQINPYLPDVDFCRARLLVDTAKLDAARAAFNQALTRCPTNGQGYLDRARLLLKLNHPNDAIADFRHGLQLLPRPAPDDFLDLAQTLHSGGHTDEALRALEDGLKRLGPALPLQTLAIDLDLARKNFDSALARIDLVLQHTQRQDRWLARRAGILAQAGRPAEAAAAYQAALTAFKALPSPLQRTPPAQAWETQVRSALAQLSTPPSDHKTTSH